MKMENRNERITLGLLVGDRSFFPAHLCDSGRKEVLAVLEKDGIDVVALPTAATKFGAVESLADAQKCAKLFKQNAGKINGTLVTLPNFGDERAVANDFAGKIRAYIGEGELTDDPLKTFGGNGVVKIPDFQKLPRYICENGFEHHVAINPTRVCRGVKEALSNYLGWDVYEHS